MEPKHVRCSRISESAEESKCAHPEGLRPWAGKCDVGLPCAIQHEVGGGNLAGFRSAAEAMLGQRFVSLPSEEAPP